MRAKGEGRRGGRGHGRRGGSEVAPGLTGLGLSLSTKSASVCGPPKEAATDNRHSVAARMTFQGQHRKTQVSIVSVWCHGGMRVGSWPSGSSGRECKSSLHTVSPAGLAS